MREKESKLLCLQEEQKGEYIIIFVPYSKSAMLQISTLQKKTKYYITSRSSKSPENFSLVAFVILKLQKQLKKFQTKYRTIFQAKEDNGRFIWLPLEFFIAHKQNVSKW